jgi:hypothetical protein
MAESFGNHPILDIIVLLQDIGKGMAECMKGLLLACYAARLSIP